MSPESIGTEGAANATQAPKMELKSQRGKPGAFADQLSEGNPEAVPDYKILPPFDIDPWTIIGANGRAFWTFFRMKAMVIRAQRNDGSLATYYSLETYQTCNGWYSPPTSVGHFYILAQTVGGAPLEDNDTGPLRTDCRFNNQLVVYTRQIPPDWFDLMVGMRINLGPGTWYACR